MWSENLDIRMTCHPGSSRTEGFLRTFGAKAKKFSGKAGRAGHPTESSDEAEADLIKKHIDRNDYYPHLTDQNTELQRGEQTCQGDTAGWWQRQMSKLGLLAPGLATSCGLLLRILAASVNFRPIRL